MTEEWVFSPCALCGEKEGEDILRLPHPDAPAQTAFIRKCRGCGLRRLWPRPGREIISKYYSDDANAFVGRQRASLKQVFWDFLRDISSGAPGRGRKLCLLRPAILPLAEWLFDINISLAHDPLPRIIDVGCGFGDLLLYWTSRGAEAFGVDTSDKAVKLGTHLGLNILEGDLIEQHLPSGSFDLAVLNHSLEHFHNPLQVLNEVARLLQPGGSVHIAVPNGASVAFETFEDSWHALLFPVHLWYFDDITLSRALELSGFSCARTRTTNMWRGYLASLWKTPKTDMPMIAYSILTVFFTSIARRHSGEILRAVAIKR